MLQALIRRILTANPDVLAACVNGGLTLLNAIIAAGLLYRSTAMIARRNLLVETVIKERAIWRSELRTAVLELSDATHSAIAQPGPNSIAYGCAGGGVVVIDRDPVESGSEVTPQNEPKGAVAKKSYSALNGCMDRHRIRP